MIEMSGENSDRLLGEKMECFAMVSDAKVWFLIDFDQQFESMVL